TYSRPGRCGAVRTPSNPVPGSTPAPVSCCHVTPRSGEANTPALVAISSGAPGAGGGESAVTVLLPATAWAPPGPLTPGASAHVWPASPLTNSGRGPPPRVASPP